MARGFIEVPIASGEDGPTLTNSTVAASIIPASRKITIPVPYFDDIGDWIELDLYGRISTAASTPGTLTFDVRFGSTVVWNGGASGTLATSASNLSWRLSVLLQCTTIGASATMRGVGVLHTAALAAATPIMLLPTSAPANGTAFDATASQTLDVFATFSVASASNILICHGYRPKWAA